MYIIILIRPEAHLGEQANMVTELRVFVASPSDVVQERDRLREVVEELNRTVADRLGLVLKLLDWRDIAPGMGRPEDVVLTQLPLEKWDVFIGILWTRFGTPPGETHPVTGQPLLSGTEEEFTLAYQAWLETGRPQMLFYRCMRPMSMDGDAVQLQRVQEFFKNFEAAGAHPGLAQIYQTVQDFERRVRADLTQLLFDYSKELLLTTRQPELAERIAELKAIEPEPPPAPRLPFINREDELKQILYTLAPPYYVVDAPAGYGKTALLRELQSRFKEREWLGAYVSVQEHRNLPAIEQALATELGITLSQGSNAPPPGLNLGKAILQQQTEEFGLEKGNKKGIVLLVDVDKKPWTSLLPTVDALFTKFIPSLERELRTLPFFQTQHNPFRVVFAGRYLAGKTPSSTPLPLTVLKLTPFDYEVVLNTVSAYLPEQKGLAQLTAHLIHYTAGHPGCIARVLQLYEEATAPPDEFFQRFTEEIWDGIVCREADLVRGDVPRELRELFDVLSIFRYVSSRVLRRVLDKTDSPLKHCSEFEIADRLTKTYLMSYWRGRLLKDAITRRLIVLHWLRQIPPQTFTAHCQHAIEICKEHLQDTKTQMPEIWTLELLFQSLQQYAEHVQNKDQRAQIRNTFYTKTVPQTMRLLAHRRDIQEEKIALKEAMDKDWEFQFTVNYSLREDTHSDHPYQRLCHQIDALSSAEPG